MTGTRSRLVLEGVPGTPGRALVPAVEQPLPEPRERVSALRGAIPDAEHGQLSKGRTRPGSGEPDAPSRSASE